MKDKIVGVTGLASGIGAATAKLFQTRGARVIGFDRNEPDYPVEAWYPVDMADAASIDSCIAKVDRRFDALVNCAGLPPTADKFAVLNVNFFGLRHFVEALDAKLNDGASIVTLASLAGLGWRNNTEIVRAGLQTSFADAHAWIGAQDVDGAPSYHLSKELVIAWTTATWDRWRGRGIRMNCVSPGPVATPILDDFIKTLGKRAEDDLKENRAGFPEEIAPVVVFLCTEDARWINGADVAVDGGAGANAWRQMLELSA